MLHNQISEAELEDIILNGENDVVEFKESACWNRNAKPAPKEDSKTQLKPIAKAVSAFLNTKGGTVIIGVADDLEVVGIEADYIARGKETGGRDDYQLFLTDAFEKCLSVGGACLPYITIAFGTIDGKELCIIQVKPYPDPANLIHLNEGSERPIYIRAPGGSKKLSAMEMMAYMKSREVAMQQTDEGKANLEQCQTEYLQHMVREHATQRNMGILQTHREVTLPTEEVYINLNASLAFGSTNVVHGERDVLYQGEASAISDEEGSLNENGINYASHDVESDLGSTTIKLNNAVSNHSHLVVLGEPGAGKTTLLRYLAVTHARALLAGEEQITGLGAVKLPIYIRIGDYAYARQQHANLALTKYLAQYYEEHNFSHKHLTQLFANKIKAGQAVILLDGLDEISDPADRVSIVRQIEELMRVSGMGEQGSRFVVTSRVAGYSAAPLGLECSHYKIQPMAPDQVAHFITVWCRAVENQSHTPNPIEATRHIDGIMRAVDSNLGVRRLATNPLLLTILALIYRSIGRIPERRIELYDQAALTLARDWQLGKGISKTQLVNEDELADVLGPLAYCMHTNRPNGLISAGDVNSFLYDALARSRELDTKNPRDLSKLRNAVKDFLERVEKYTGLFVQRGYDADRQPLYGFMHLTFEEYYAARYLATYYADDDQLIAILRSHLHDPRWEEVVLLTLGYIAFISRLPRKARAILEQLCLAKERIPSSYEELFHRDLLFALRVCADDVPPSKEYLEGLANRTLELFFNRNPDYGLGRYELLREQIKARLQSVRGGKAGELITELLLDKMADKDSGTLTMVIEALAAIGVGNKEVVTRLNYNLDRYKQPSIGIRCRSVEALAIVGIGDEYVIQLLLDVLGRDPNAPVRSSAAMALGVLGVGNQGVLDALVWTQRTDANAEVQARCLRAIGRIGISNDNVVEAVLNTLTRDDSTAVVRSSAIATLGRLGNASPQVIETLMRVVQSANDQGTYQSAAAALGDLSANTPALADNLLLLLHVDGNPKTKLGFSLALARTGLRKPSIVSSLLQLIGRSTDAELKSSLVTTLGFLSLGSKQEINVLHNLLDKDISGLVRGRAAEALGRIGKPNPDTIRLLLQAINKREQASVQASAITALVKLGARGKGTDDSLIKSLNDHDMEVPSRAALALGTLGVSTDAAVSALLAIITSRALQANHATGIIASSATALGMLADKLGAKKESVKGGLKRLCENTSINQGVSVYNAAYQALYAVVSTEHNSEADDICLCLQ